MAQITKTTQKETTPEAQKNKPVKKVGPAIVWFTIGAIMGVGVLSSLRVDTNKMDAELIALNKLIAEKQEELKGLGREVTALTSPSRIYASAIGRLGMTQVHLAGTIRLDLKMKEGTAAAKLPKLSSAEIQ